MVNKRYEEESHDFNDVYCFGISYNDGGDTLPAAN